jgi:cytochrome d ubiquinol oxidase subunit II
MDNPNFYQTVWYLLIGVLFVGYSILDGFDLGVGMLFPFLANDDGEKSALIRSIGPVWDGNEVWLLTAGGALFAAFPLAYATVFSGFYLALMLVLFALIFRAVSLEFWTYDEPRRKAWGWAFAIGSFLPSLLYGVALGNVVYGVPISADFEYAGGFFTLLRPYPLLIGLLGLAAIVLQGSTYTALKTDGRLRDSARKVSSALLYVLGALFVAATATHLTVAPSSASLPLFWIFAALFFIAWGVNRLALAKGRDMLSFIMSSAGFAAMWGIAGSVHFPRLVTSLDPAHAITAMNAASGPMTLRVMLIIAGLGMPVVILYTIFVYRIFKGKVTA